MKSTSSIPTPFARCILGAWFRPIKMQGKNVGVIYSAEHRASTKSELIV